MKPLSAFADSRWRAPLMPGLDSEVAACRIRCRVSGSVVAAALSTRLRRLLRAISMRASRQEPLRWMAYPCSGEPAAAQADIGTAAAVAACQLLSSGSPCLLAPTLEPIARSLGIEAMIALGSARQSDTLTVSVLAEWQRPRSHAAARLLQRLREMPEVEPHGVARSSVGAAVEQHRAASADAGELLCVPIGTAVIRWGWVAIASPAGVAWSEPQRVLVRLLAQALVASLLREQRLLELESVEQRVEQLARTDVLTGLANRRAFNERLRQAFAQARRGAPGFAVLYLDLDRFKQINDVLGHRVGDRLLEQVGERLRASTRATDLVARLGGDEFAIVQAELTGSSAAARLAGKLIETVSAPFSIDGLDLCVGLTVGVALYGEHSIGADALLGQADQALYRAKQAGGGQYRFYTEELDREARAHLILSEQLRGAIGSDQLELHYRPQIELRSDLILGIEALLRWRHAERGLLLAEDFMPAAEKFGLTRQLGRWQLDRACRQLARWRQAGLKVPLLAIGLTLAQVKLAGELVRDVVEAIARWGLKPADLELGVSEQVLASATLMQSNALEQLRQAGVLIAIDDFGSRCSSLDYLRAYRMRRLKIASGMFGAAGPHAGGSAMIRAILHLAAELGVRVVAEGVEEPAHREVFTKASLRAPTRNPRCSYYYQALPAEEATAVLRAGPMPVQA